MDIEEVREYALSLSPMVTEELFAEEWTADIQKSIHNE